jgi:hypothetical protein
MTITYQQAKRIRKSSLTGLIADQLQYEKKIGTAVKKAISLKTRGTIMGLTQKFDPLNIAKILTFGSSLGPAILGHLTKRDARDIQYFTGRLKPIRESKGRVEKIGRLGAMDDAVSSPVLQQIYSHLLKTRDENKQRAQLQMNYEEEYKIESERRHKELLEVLSGLGGKTITVTKIKKEESGVGGFLDRIREMIGGAVNGLKSMVETLFQNFAKWVTKSLEVLTKSLSTLVRLAVAPLRLLLGNPIVLGALAALAGAYAIKGFRESETGLKTNIARLDRYIPQKQYELDREIRLFGENSPKVAPKREALQKLMDERKGYQQKLDELGSSEGKEKETTSVFDKFKSMITGDYDKMFEKPDFKADMPDLKFPNLESPTPTPERVQPTPISEMTKDRAQSARADFAKVDPRLKIVTGEMDTKGNMLNRVTNENIQNKLETKTAPPEPVVNNTNINKTSQTTTIKKNLPNVRNSEATFQRMIFDSTRVV